MNEWIMLLRVVLAVAAGTAIGMERALRYKEAGIRTHALICGGAALFVLVSQYSFLQLVLNDVLLIYFQLIQLLI